MATHIPDILAHERAILEIIAHYVDALTHAIRHHPKGRGHALAQQKQATPLQPNRTTKTC